MQDEFWKKPLAQLSAEEWEALCDGCGRCCVNKLEDEDTGELYFTAVSCTLLDPEQCRCRDYANRRQNVPECLVINLAPGSFRDLPDTCAYRLRFDGEALPDWHPLICGDPRRVHDEGISVRGKVIPEDHVHPDDLPGHIINWIVPAAKRQA